MAVWEILQAVASGAYSDVAIERTFRKYSLTEVDRAFVMELSCGAIRQRLFLDSWIDYLGKVPALKQPPLLRWLLHIGMYQIFFMQRVPISAIVNTSVELSKERNLGHLSKVVNAILRRAMRAHENGETLPIRGNKVEQFAKSFSIPIWLAQGLIDWRGEAKALITAQALNKPPSIDLRVNRMKSDVKNVQEKFKSLGFKSHSIEGSPYGIEVVSSFGDLREWPGYREGEWSVQDRSAQWVAPLLEAKPGERILDACAAPGGKTTHIAELVDDSSEVWAVDRSSNRLKTTSSNVDRLGFNCVNFLKADSSSLLERFPSWRGYFDRILLDAPCSGLGTLARNPDARWKITPSKITELVRVQSKLLENLLPLLKVGGRIVYSTCTFHPKENFFQIENLMSLHHYLRLISQKQIWPGEEYGDGFYAAIIDI
ncbi:16S rRNA (cytosine(967)-C(5))-methyltransferase [Prochlorococcus marinus]|uniref:16S rRNA (cytosine(967)-C(5))-methyltransferase n=1 Tax=Prochlorococcus marinus TaxID=1219 RepID=UPI0022B5B787|nr:16S rRNA (cytosine(967)-C(5))-methyltransferase [Prochlorococcus marinus]